MALRSSRHCRARRGEQHPSSFRGGQRRLWQSVSVLNRVRNAWASRRTSSPRSRSAGRCRLMTLRR